MRSATRNGQAQDVSTDQRLGETANDRCKWPESSHNQNGRRGRREINMPQSLVTNLLHLVYSTKHRQPWIPDTVRESLCAYQAGIFREWESPALIIGGVDDHVHALFALSKNHPLKKIVEEVKKGSSKWMKTAQGTGNEHFQWQAGYAAFSVSASSADDVRKYIARQAEHHRKMSYQDELRAMFARHGMEFDERYVWD